MLSKIIPLVDCSVLRQCHMCVGSWNLGPFVTSNKAKSVVVVVRLSIYQDYGIKTIFLVQYNYKTRKIRCNGPILSQTMLIVGQALTHWRLVLDVQDIQDILDNIQHIQDNIRSSCLLHLPPVFLFCLPHLRYYNMRNTTQ